VRCYAGWLAGYLSGCLFVCLFVCLADTHQKTSDIGEALRSAPEAIADVSAAEPLAGGWPVSGRPARGRRKDGGRKEGRKKGEKRSRIKGPSVLILKPALR
jgi:hypothetical protein